MNSVISFIQKTKRKCEGEENTCRELGFDVFRERVCHFSLRSRAIRPSDFFGPIRKAVLHSEGYVWAPVLRSFDKIREVGVLSYLKLHFV